MKYTRGQSIQIREDKQWSFRKDEHASSDSGRMSEPRRGEFAQELERKGACEE